MTKYIHRVRLKRLLAKLGISSAEKSNVEDILANIDEILATSNAGKNSWYADLAPGDVIEGFMEEVKKR